MLRASSDNEHLYSIIQIVQTYSDPQSLLQEITETIGKGWSLDGCFIICGLANQTKSHLAYWTKTNDIKIFPQSLKAFFTKLEQENKAPDNWPVIIDAPKDLSFNPLNSWQSLLVGRIIFRGNLHGFILLGHKKPHIWSEQELYELKQLQDILAITCFIIQPNQTSPTLRQSLLKKWYKETQEQIASKKNLLDLQEQIITMLSDRIRNPLSSIKMAVQLLEISNEPEEKYWTILKQAYSQIEELFKSITILRNIQAQELTFNWESIILELLLEEIAEAFQTRWQSDRKKQLQLLLEIEPTSNPISLYSDSQHLKTIFFELLTNAENFSTPQSRVYLKLSEDSHQIKIELINQGLKISPEEINCIFDPFRRGSEAIKKSIPGIGIGLTLVKGLVDYLGGRIEVNSHPINSDDLHLTSFILSFPQ